MPYNASRIWSLLAVGFFILLLCCFLVVFVCFLVCYYNKNFHGPLKNLESYCVEIAKYNMKLKCT